MNRTNRSNVKVRRVKDGSFGHCHEVTIAGRYAGYVVRCPETGIWWGRADNMAIVEGRTKDEAVQATVRTMAKEIAKRIKKGAR